MIRGAAMSIAGLIVLAVLANEIRAANWPQFRGPTGLNYTDEKNLPLTWNAKTGENILWKSPLPKSDNPYSSPIVWGDRVFVTCVVNQPLEHHVLCFQVGDGKQLWDVTVPPGPWFLKDLRGGYGAPTPTTDGKNVFVVFGSAVVAALDFDGKIIWRKELEKINFDVAMGGSPILYQDTVILDCDQNGKTSSFIAFDKKSGEIKWEEKRPQVAFAHSTPVIVSVGGKKQMLVSASNAIQGLDPATGKILWWCAAPGDATSPAFGGGLIFSDSGRGGKAVCVDPTGAGDVTKTHLKWTFPQIPEGLSSAIIVGDLIFRTHNPETLRCIKLATGEPVFSERLVGVSTWANPFATPEGNIYFASAGKSFVVKAADKLEVQATNEIGEENRASAAVSDGKIFLRGGKNLYCIGKKL
ncbi:MAG: hypothetical protein EXS33_06525 [Pedosphaera sp.]|nr:hypothetical protein [Pedosphaera sp.]